MLHTLIFTEKEVSATDGRWFMVRIMPYRTQENRIVGLVITFHDITIAKNLEQSLREQKESFRLLFEVMPVGTILQNPDGKIVMANPEAVRMIGISLKDMQGQTLSELQWKLVRKDGSDSPVEEYPDVVALRTGKPVSGIVMGMVHSSETKRIWIKASAVPLLREGEKKPYQVYLMFLEIAEPG